MNLNGNGGFGLCGHKNTFTCTAKYGNWVEDIIGGELTVAPRAGKISYDTESRRQYIPPSEMPVHPSTANKKDKLTIEELKSKNKEGLPYSLVFNHGLKEEKIENRFQTTNQLACFHTPVEQYGLPSNYKSQERAKALRREMKLTNSKISESHDAALRTSLPSEFQKMASDL
eukprot:gene10588-22097_t